MQLALEQSFDFLEALKGNPGHNPEAMAVMAAMLAVVLLAHRLESRMHERRI
jgi:hypothetical protein